MVAFLDFICKPFRNEAKLRYLFKTDFYLSLFLWSSYGLLAWFANEPISMMAATFQSDINHQSEWEQQKIKHTQLQV